MSIKQRYILCPRCELNYILENEKYCNVCKAELGIIDKSILIPDEEENEERMCPICHTNILEGDEEVCFECRNKERYEKEQELPDENDDSWRDFLDEDDEVASPEELEISLELAAEEESEEDEGDDGYANPDDLDYGSKKKNDPDDDFDDEFDNIDESDFDDDEDDEDDDDDDDEDDEEDDDDDDD